MSGRVRTAVIGAPRDSAGATRSTLGRGASRVTGTRVPHLPGFLPYVARTVRLSGSESDGRRVVLGAAEVVVENLAEDRLVGRGVREEGHRGAQLLRVDR